MVEFGSDQPRNGRGHSLVARTLIGTGVITL